MSDEKVFAARLMGVGYVIRGLKPNVDLELNHNQWEMLGGPPLKHGEMLYIRPLRIERVEVPHER